MVEPGDRARKSIHATLEGSSRAGGSGRNGGDLGRYVFCLSGDESTANSRQGLMLCGTNSPGCECFGYCCLLAQPAKFPEFGCRMQHGSRSRSLVSAHELGRASPGGGCYRIIRQYSVEQMAWVCENKPRFLRQS